MPQATVQLATHAVGEYLVCTQVETVTWGDGRGEYALILTREASLDLMTYSGMSRVRTLATALGRVWPYARVRT